MLLLQNHQRLHEQGEKAGCLPAHQICQSAASRIIAEISTATGEVTIDQQEITMILNHFFSQTFTPPNQK